MGSYGGGVRRDLGVGLEAEVGIGIGVGRGMSVRSDAVASEAAEALAEEETPGNGERKSDTVLYPVNQWIAAGKPVVSQNNVTG